MRRYHLFSQRGIGLLLATLGGLTSCRDVPRVDQGETPSSGVVSTLKTIPVRGNQLFVENSATVTSVIQPGIIFGVNDSGNEAYLFALDSLGNDRGVWVVGTYYIRNHDWEAMAEGPCPGWGRRTRQPSQGIDEGVAADSGSRCLFIADIGDNDASRAYLTLFRLKEPTVPPETPSGLLGQLEAERVDFRYDGLAADAEAMYVSANGDAFFITKRRLLRPDLSARPALVFRLPASAWLANRFATAQLVDSLPLFPGWKPGGLITDASLSRDRTRLVVRTYTEVYVFPVDPSSGRPLAGARWWSCPVSSLRERQGEGIAWWWDDSSLVLSSEGRNAPLHVIRCDKPPA